jgi:hypothetical protein
MARRTQSDFRLAVENSSGDCMRLKVSALLVFVATLSTASGCQSPNRASTPNNAKKSADTVIVHQFAPGTTLIEHGDSLRWIHTHKTKEGTQRIDTTVIVFHGESSVQLTKNGPVPMTASMTAQFRRLLDFARKQEVIERDLGHPIR